MKTHALIKEKSMSFVLNLKKMKTKTTLSLLLLLTTVFTSVKAQSPTAAAMNFNVFVSGDAYLSKTHNHGAIAVGGNLYVTGGYEISDKSSSGTFKVLGVPVVLAVKGGVVLSSELKINNTRYAKIGNCANPTSLTAWYNSGNIRVTPGSYDTNPAIMINSNANAWNPPVSNMNNPICENVFGTGAGKINIDAAFTELNKQSNHLATLPNNVTLGDQNGNTISTSGPYVSSNGLDKKPKVRLTTDQANKINVISFSAAVWEYFDELNFENLPTGAGEGAELPNKNFGLIINITGVKSYLANKGATTLKFPRLNIGGENKSGYVLYNISDTDATITLGGAEIYGSILAPKSTLIKNASANLSGQVIAKSFTHNGDEHHYFTFQSTTPPPVVENEISVVATSKCINNAAILEYTVTPNFDATGQTVKIEWLNRDNEVVTINENKSLSGKILFPGSDTTAQGKGNAWPGYILNNGKWEINSLDDNASLRLAGAQVRITLPPSQTVSITFPVSTETCFTTPPPTTDQPLPVTISGFTATANDCQVDLKWKVTEAINFSHFVVQRSTDGQNFLSLKNINFNANQTEYSYKDTPSKIDGASRNTYYYRLQEVDLNGITDYSIMRSAITANCIGQQLSINYYPNPTAQEINLTSLSAIARVEIYTLTGQNVYNYLPTTNITQLEIDLRNLATGTYIMNVLNAQGRQVAKIIKQ